jgi:uncharacterized membrane protein YccC
MLWARLAITDPGLLRLLLAARGTLSVGLTTSALWLVCAVTGQPITELAFGAVFSMVAPFIMRDPIRRQRLITLLLLLPTAAAAVVAVSLVHAHPPAGELWFLSLVFVSALLQTRHPRVLGLGLIAVIMSYVGLYLGLPAATLPAQLGSLGVAATIVGTVCFVLLPLRPAVTLRRAIDAVRRRAGSILHEASSAADPQLRATFRHHLAGLNAAALAAEDQLVLLDPQAKLDVRLHLFELEQAVTQLIGLVARGAVPDRHWDRFRLASERLRRGRQSRRAATRATPDPVMTDPVQAALQALSHASIALEQAASRAVAAATAPVAAPPPPPGPLAWRTAAQMTLASVVAMAGGMMLSPQRWFWAVIAAYVVFLNARSRGDTIYRGSHRIAGTLAGLFGGLAISTLVARNGLAESAIMLGAVFGTYYFLAVSYGIAIFCVTVLLGMVYGALGTSVEPLLLLRLEETAIGVFAAAVAASFVWPMPTHRQVQLSGLAVLRALLEVVQASLTAIASGASPEPIEAVRLLDRRIGDLRLALAPVNAGRFMMRRARAERPVTALLACAEAARALAAVAAKGGSVTGLASLRSQAEAVEARIAAMLGGVTLPEQKPGKEQKSGKEQEPGQPAFGDDPAGAALRRLDLALAMLAERLEASAVEGFAVS